MTTSTRKAEILIAGEWTDIAFEHLRPGDTYRLFEEDGAPVIDKEDNRSTTVFKILGEPFQLPNGIWGVQDESVWDFKYGEAS